MTTAAQPPAADPGPSRRTSSFAPTLSGLGLGIDIGGTGMKAAIVDRATGELVTERYRVDTPQPATPAAMADVVVHLVEHHDWSGPVGVAFPAIVRHGIVGSAANIDSSWIDVDADALFTQRCGHPVHLLNDADAAGVAEVLFGAARHRPGVVLMLTFGTGIGSGLFIDGNLVPNTELGHLELDGAVAEHRAAASARKREGLSWKAWADRVQVYLEHLERLFSPDLIVVGGGASKQHERWLPRIRLDVDIVPAAMANSAGIVGAALMSESP